MNLSGKSIAKELDEYVIEHCERKHLKESTKCLDKFMARFTADRLTELYSRFYHNVDKILSLERYIKRVQIEDPRCYIDDYKHKLNICLDSSRNLIYTILLYQIVVYSLKDEKECAKTQLMRDYFCYSLQVGYSTRGSIHEYDLANGARNAAILDLADAIKLDWRKMFDTIFAGISVETPLFPHGYYRFPWSRRDKVETGGECPDVVEV